MTPTRDGTSSRRKNAFNRARCRNRPRSGQIRWPRSSVNGPWRGTQVVRERSAKPLHASSILARASTLLQRDSYLALATDCSFNAGPWRSESAHNLMTNRVRKTIDQLRGTDPQIIVEASFVVLELEPELSPTAEELSEFITPDIGTKMLS